MNAQPVNPLSAMMDRLFDALGYERKKPPQLTRIIILKSEPITLAPARLPQPQSLPTRPYRY